MIYLGKNAVGISDTVQVVSEDIVNRVNAVEIKETVSTPSNILTIYDGADNVPVDELVVGIEPVQDLHGYDNPWPAGGGKNVLAPVVSSTLNGITCTVAEDGTVTLNGTATDVTTFEGPYNNFTWDGTTQYWLSGCPSGGDYSAGYSLRVSAEGNGEFSKPDIGSGIALQSYTSSKPIADKPLRYTVVVRSGVVCNNLVFKPMLSAGTSAGEYAPYSNICPISGRTGVNIWAAGENLFNIADAFVGTSQNVNGNTISKGTTAYNFDLFNGTTGASALATKTMFLKAGSYTISGTVIGDGTIRGYIVDANGTVSNTYLFGLGSADSSKTFIVPEDTRFTLRYSNKNEHTITNLQIESGNTASAYQDFHGASFSVQFPTEAGTVYGGTLTIHKDGTGTLSVDRATVTLTGDNFIDEGTSSGGVKYYRAGNAIVNGSGSNGAISNQYVVTTSAVDKAFRIVNANVYVYDNSIADLTACKTLFDLNPLQVVYVLGSSQTYELTALEVIATLKGTNNLWTDTGAIQSLTYSADPKLYVDQHIPAVPVQDVQVNGTSILSQGVANVPIASDSVPGAVKVSYTYGISNDDGMLKIAYAGDNYIKLGSEARQPIVPWKQHLSTFYGLAKAAGADMASSSNPVGTYTDAAKVAIQKMLGIYQAPWEVIRVDTFTNETSQSHEITVDNNGQPFELTDLIIRLETPKQETASAIESYGGITCNYSGGVDYLYVNAWTQAANASPTFAYAFIEQENGLLTKTQVRKGNSGDMNSLDYVTSAVGAGAQDPFRTLSSKRIYTSVALLQSYGTVKITIYGKRKW